MCISVIDVEASGFGPDSYPIEVGVVKHTGERYCRLILPHHSWSSWSEEAEQLHGITRPTLERSGAALTTVCSELNHFLGDEDVFTDALSHDQHWLNRLYHTVGIVPMFTLRAIEHITTEQQILNWDEAKEQVAQGLRFMRHRASGDAFIIQQTFVRLGGRAIRSRL